MNSNLVTTKQFAHIHILVKIDVYSFNYLGNYNIYLIGIPDSYEDEDNCSKFLFGDATHTKDADF